MGKMNTNTRFLSFIFVFLLAIFLMAVSYAEVVDTAYAMPFSWKNHTLCVSYDLDDGTVNSGHAASGEKSVQVFLVCTSDTLSWIEITGSGQDFELQALDGTIYKAVSSGFQAVEGSSRNIADLATNQYVGFSPIFDVPKDISFDELLLIVINSETNETIAISLAGVPAEAVLPENTLPEELVGVWNGTGTPVSGGSTISLSLTVNSNGTGAYSFEQAGYTESYPFILQNNSSQFSVNIPVDNQLGIAACEGMYAYVNNILTLHITTTFSSGRQFEYIVDCTKAEP